MGKLARAFSLFPLWPGPRHHHWNPFWYIASVPTLSIGHCFGIVPAPGSFASSAFPAPPKKSSETAPKISCVPPKKQPLALGAVSTRFRVPQLQGQKQENNHARKRSSSNRLSWQKPGAQVRQGVRPQVRGSFAGDSAVLEGCRRRMALQDGVASRRSLERSRRVRSDEAAERRPHLRRRHASEQHLREGVRQRQEQDHGAVQGLASEGGFHPQAQPRQERASVGQSAGCCSAGGGAVLAIRL